MKKVPLATTVALIALAAAADSAPFSLPAKTAKHDLTIMPIPPAPREEHAALDEQFALLTEPGRAAPGWAHAVLDWLWDMFL